MRKTILTIAALVSVALLALPAFAADHTDDASEMSVNTYGEVRARAEILENYFDLDDDDNFDSASFGAWRANIGAESEFVNNVLGVIELQGYGVWGLGSPDQSTQDPFGQTVLFPDEDDEVTLRMYQAHVTLQKLGRKEMNLRIGRSTHQIGNELMLGNADFYNGTVYDGARLWWESDRYTPEFFFYIVDEEDVDEDRNNAADPDPTGADDDVTLSGFALDIGLGDDGQHVQPYLIYYRDGDYTSGGGKLWTLGAMYGRPMPTSVSDSVFDWSVELAIQSGDFEPNGANLDFGGSILEGWLGFNLPHSGKSGHSRIHVGALIASGDDDITDSDLDGFMPLFPDTHAYNRAGDLDLFAGAGSLGLFTGFGANNSIQPLVNGFGLAGNSGLSNLTDFNVGYGYHGERHSFKASVHLLSLTEDAIHRAVFLTTDDDIGTELDLLYNFAYSKNLGFQVGASQLSLGDFVEQVAGPSSDDITRIYGQAHLAWD